MKVENLCVMVTDLGDLSEHLANIIFDKKGIDCASHGQKQLLLTI